MSKLLKFRAHLGNAKRAAHGLLHNSLEPLKSQAAHPAPASIIGMSSGQRNIEAFTLGTGDQRILVISGIHGNEVGTIKLAYKLLNWLNEQDRYLRAFTFSIIPTLNPDGFAQAKQHPDYRHGGLVGRFNGHGVDLNRNFPTPSFQSNSVWGRGKRYSETTPVYCGETGGSEPETQTLISHIRNFQPHVYLAFHNAAGDVMGNNNELSQKLTDIFSAASGYHRETLADWEALGQTGTAKEWCETQQLPYVEIEGRYRWGTDWKNQKKGVEAILEYLTKNHANQR